MHPRAPSGSLSSHVAVNDAPGEMEQDQIRSLLIPQWGNLTVKEKKTLNSKRNKRKMPV